MKQTFNLNTSYSSYNEDTVELSFDFDARELVIVEGGACLVTIYLKRNELELKRIHKCIGALLEEMGDE